MKVIFRWLCVVIISQLSIIYTLGWGVVFKNVTYFKSVDAMLTAFLGVSEMIGCSGSPSPLPVNAYWAWILHCLGCPHVCSVICTLSPCYFCTNPTGFDPHRWVVHGWQWKGKEASWWGIMFGNGTLCWKHDWDVGRVWNQSNKAVKVTHFRHGKKLNLSSIESPSLQISASSLSQHPVCQCNLTWMNN